MQFWSMEYFGHRNAPTSERRASGRVGLWPAMGVPPDIRECLAAWLPQEARLSCVQRVQAGRLNRRAGRTTLPDPFPTVEHYGEALVPGTNIP